MMSHFVPYLLVPEVPPKFPEIPYNLLAPYKTERYFLVLTAYNGECFFTARRWPPDGGSAVG